MNQDPFKEYIKQSEPNKRDKGYAWSTAIGLQAVDGLEPSEQLVKTAIENIEGYITMEDAEKRINSYYKTIEKRNVSPSSSVYVSKAEIPGFKA